MAQVVTSRFVQACRRETVDCTPVWFMRQAGRYMAEYRAIRAKHSMLELCSSPDLITEVTLQPIRSLGVDAAIIFSDILLPFVPMGLDLDYVKGEGPQIGNPIRTVADVNRLKPVNVDEALAFVPSAIRQVTQELGSTPLIGFAGGPFTLASYAIEGGSSRQHRLTKEFMYREPDAWHALLHKFATVVADLLEAQVAAGASAVQLFDSWIGQLAPADYHEYVLPHSRTIFQRIAPLGVPSIHFGVNTESLLPLLRTAGGDVIGIDWRTPIDLAWDVIGSDRALQGNLDPTTLLAPHYRIRAHIERILHEAGGRRGHIFNLGHGILPNTPVDTVRYVVDTVHELTTD